MNCQKLKEKIVARNQFFKGVRGRVRLKSKDHSLNLNAVLAHKDKARFEIKGPFNTVLGLFTSNSQWIQLFVPKEKTVYRFPYAEFYKDNIRRDRFLNLLPIKLETEVLFETMMSMVLVDEKSAMPCRYNSEKNVYIVQSLINSKTRLFYVDPTTYSPLKLYFFKSFNPSLRDHQESVHRADYVVRYESQVGEGLATFPSKITMNDGKQDVVQIHWKEAEAWLGASDELFRWSPPASINIEHY